MQTRNFRVFAVSLFTFGLSAISSLAQVNIPASAAVSGPLGFPDGKLKAEYWKRSPNTIATDGAGNPANRVDVQINSFGPATGTFIASNFVYLGNDLTPIRDWLGVDAVTYSGVNSNLDDGAFRFRGYIDVAAPGTVNLGCNTDDGSRITIAGIDLVNDDSGHGDATVSADAVFEAAGVYPIEVTYFNGDWTSDGNNHSGNTDPGVHGGANFRLLVNGANVNSANVGMFHADIPPSPQTNVIFGMTNQIWKFNSNGVDLTDVYNQPAYDDSAWPSSIALFGQESTPAEYAPFLIPVPGDPNFIPTTANGGPTTVYFRTHFTYSGSPAGVTLIASNLIDDGAVYYLNGIEVDRIRVAAPQTFGTFSANQAAEGVVEVRTWASGALQSGDNVIAVELHNGSATSSDGVFGMGLAAVPALAATIVDPTQPTNRTVLANRSTTLIVRATGSPAPTYQWFKDGNPIDPLGNATATSSSLVISNMQPTDAGNYFARVSNASGTVDSRTAVVSYLNDTNPPVPLKAVLNAAGTQVTILFNELLDGTASQDPFSYAFGSGNSASSATLYGSNVVLVLTTPATSADTVTVNGLSDAAGNAMTDPVTLPFQPAILNSCSGLSFDYYNNLSTGNNNIRQTLLSDPRFIAQTPTARYNVAVFDSQAVGVTPSGDFSNNSIEGYGAQMRGFFVPPVSGNWVFYARSDDSSIVYLNPTGTDPTGKVLIVEQAGCCNTLGDPAISSEANPRFLVGGLAYYIEGVYKEGTGGDYLQVAARLAGSPDALAPIAGDSLGQFTQPGSGGQFTITQQPADVDVQANVIVSFSVGASAQPSFLATCIQWQRKSAGDPDFSDIAGAHAPSYSFGPVTLADDGAQFRALVSVVGTNGASRAATLHVTVDTNGPTCVSATPSPNLTNIVVRFSEFLDPGTGQDRFNYDVPGFTVIAASLNSDNKSVTLTLDAPMSTGAAYQVTVAGVTDLAGNPIVPNPCTLNFRAPVVSCGFLVFQVFPGESTSDNTIDNTVLMDPNFPSKPAETYYISGFDTRLAYPNDSHEGYGGLIYGYFIPPTSGNWIFYLRSDDSSRLFLNPNGADPAGATLITEETGCCGTFSAHASAPQALTAGQQYYIQVIYKEGTGGDYAQVAAKLDTDPANPDTLRPISGAYLAGNASPVGASINITQQPTDQVFLITPDNIMDETFNSSDGGFTVQTPVPYDGPWTYNGAAGSWDQAGQQAEDSHPNTSILTSSQVNVTKSGGVVLTLSHRYSFEYDGTAWDGGQVLMSVNGGPFVTVSNFTANGYGGWDPGTGARIGTDTVASNSRSDLHGQVAFIADSTNYNGGFINSVANLGNFNPGDSIRLQFIAASDTNTRGHLVPNWQIDHVVLVQGGGAGPQPVCFTVAATTSTQPVFYQWDRDSGSGFAPIAGANGASYCILPVCTDSGSRFRVRIYIPGATVTSATGSLLVTAPNSAPRFAVTPPPASNEDGGAQNVPNTAHDIAPGSAAVVASAPTIGLNFGADEPNQAPNAGLSSILAPSDRAGVVPQLNWNNEVGNSGSASGLVADYGNTPVATVASVSWTCPNTWSSTGDGEENNAFPAGPNKTLMTGYLDSDNGAGVVTITVSGLGSEFTAGGYDVIVYALGGTSANRYGAYSIGSVTQILNSAANPTGFVLDAGTGTNDMGDYAVFSGQTGSSFTLIGNAVTPVDGNGFRAPVNAIQIVAHTAAQTPIYSFASTFDSLPAGATLFHGTDAGPTPADPDASKGYLGDDGSGNNKVLHLTDAGTNAAYGGMLINLGSTLTFQSFEAHWKSRVGGGQNGGADGYSFNIATDLPDPPSYGNPGEEGAGTGLSVTVDTFDNGTGLDVGLDIKWGGLRVAYAGIPKDDPGDGNFLRKDTFVDASITVDAHGLATAVYDGNVITAQLPAYAGVRANKVELGARTGGANDNQWVDNLTMLGFGAAACGDESGQAVHFNVSNDNPGLFSVQPAIGPDGTLTYTAAPNKSGVAHVTVVAMDNGGTAFGGSDTSAPRTFDIVVNAVNDCPSAFGTNIVVQAGSSVTFQLSASDPEGDALQYIITQPPLHGVLTINIATGVATYTPAPGYFGPDSFKFKVNDGTCDSAEALVTIDVRGTANHCPVAGLLSLTVDANSFVSFQLPGSDADGNPLTYIVTQPPAHGVLAVNALTGAGSYTPAPGYTGPDSFKYKVNDGLCDSAEATVTISVGRPNTPPHCVAALTMSSCPLTFPNDPTIYAITFDSAPLVDEHGHIKKDKPGEPLPACVLLDASGSTDADMDTLTFKWTEGTNILGTTAIVSNCFAYGCHTIVLEVSDGRDTCRTVLQLCVVKASETVQKCIDLVQNSSFPKNKKRELVESLKHAQSEFDKEKFKQGVDKLEATQNKVRHELLKKYPIQAQAVIDCIQRIIDAVVCAGEDHSHSHDDKPDTHHR